MADTPDRRRSAGPGSEVVLRLPLLVALAAAIPLLSAIAVAVLPSVAFAWRSEALHVGIETAASVVAVLAAYLVLGRFRLSGSLRDLALFGALSLLALTNLAFSALPALIAEGPTRFVTWAPEGARALAAIGFASAAFLPDLRLPRPRRSAAAVLAGTVVLLGAAAVAVILLGSRLPSTAAPGLGPADSDTPNLDVSKGLLTLHVITLALYAIAAAGFSLRARRARDELMAWFAVGATLAAASRVHYFLFASSDPELVYSGDLVRLCFYLALLVGALREIGDYQRRIAVAAVLDERRRMARDLHDGLAQELAFVSTQARLLERAPDAGRAANVAVAAERALDESRSAIRALTRRSDEPFAEEVAQVAEQLAGRAGARLRLELEADVNPPPETREHLLRILREAVTNGVRHGEATTIAVELSGEPGLRLLVSDNGKGFDPNASNDGGFGLTSMRERATSLGGELSVRSRPGEGTEVEVVLP